MIKFSKIQTVIWGVMAMVIGFAADTIVKDFVSFAVVLMIFLLFVSMTYFNYRFYEELKDRFI